MPLLFAQGSIPAVCSTGTDMDGDGIADILDTDTDNDGIPDVEESATGSVLVDGQPTTRNGMTISSETNLSEGDILLISNVITIEGTPIDLQIVIDSLTTGVTYDPTSGGFNLTPYNSSIDDLFGATLTFVESGTSTPYVLDAVEVIFRDIDSQADRDFTELVGLSGMPIVQLGDSLVMQNYENGGGIAGFMNYGVSKSVTGATTDWLDEPNVNASNTDYWLTATYGDVSTLQFSYGVTGTLGNNSGSRGTSLSNIIYFQGLDTDGDLSLIHI